MNRLTQFCISLVFGLACALTAVAQTPQAPEYTPPEAVSSGVFANFTYPSRPLFDGDNYHGKRSFTLRRGIFEPGLDERGWIKRLGAYLKSVQFVDVTGDGRKEAIVTIGNICDCSGVWFGIYIYKLTGRQPTRLLWAFATGDRAVGGLRHVYGRSGRLIVELYGVGSGPNSPPKIYYGAQCCTSDYTRRRYRWNGSRFVQVGKARLLS